MKALLATSALTAALLTAAGPGHAASYQTCTVSGGCKATGNYASANSDMAGQNTFNAALAKMLGGDAAGAGTILAASSDKDSAQGLYLAAIIAARTNNGDGVRSNRLRSSSGSRLEMP